MSLERIKGEIVFTCDECDDTLETGTDDFQEGRNTLRTEEWTTRKNGEAWEHVCPSCGRDHKAATFKRWMD